ncbi:hypothetical protein D0911_12905 [Zhongshania marina]|jgi:hypothetical protein|uniref:Uncharacterized protein n=1 Tax=Zhongshania marina TaxID=2304603 RepID=A0ABX9W0E0_9GAMM|nr:hypothetical protein D0911_12905 [Zhongshania marina]
MGSNLKLNDNANENACQLSSCNYCSVVSIAHDYGGDKKIQWDWAGAACMIADLNHVFTAFLAV